MIGFTSPLEVRGEWGGLQKKNKEKLARLAFPSPTEVSGGYYAEKLYSIAVSRFGFRSLPGRLEVLTVTRRAMFHNLLVSVPSRGDWGF